jgi:hypothetical protein
MKDSDISQIFGDDSEYFENIKKGKVGTTGEDVVDDEMQYSTNFMEVFRYEHNPRDQWTQPADIHCMLPVKDFFFLEYGLRIF